MALSFDYQCHRCRITKSNQELESFSCECGGAFSLVDRAVAEKVPYDLHWNERLGKYITSWSEMERECERHRSPEHPKGFKLRNADSKVMKEMEWLRKNKEEIHQEGYRKVGISYKRGSNTNWSDHHGTFVPRGADYIRPPRKRTYSFGT